MQILNIEPNKKKKIILKIVLNLICFFLFEII
jgi:hypothetical protein